MVSKLNTFFVCLFSESIIEEALRLSSASIMIRVASDDFTLTLDSGQTADVRKGDYIALYPQLIHLDPEIYPNPTVCVQTYYVNYFLLTNELSQTTSLYKLDRF